MRLYMMHAFPCVSGLLLICLGRVCIDVRGWGEGRVLRIAVIVLPTDLYGLQFRIKDYPGDIMLYDYFKSHLIHFTEM